MTVRVRRMRERCKGTLPKKAAALLYDAFMPSPLATTLAVADAITHYRQIRELTRDELSYVLVALGHPIASDELAAMERCERLVTVDDLMALSYALDTTPAILLAHAPIDMPPGDGPVATGVPVDAEHTELRAWVEGRTRLDDESRTAWWEERVSRQRIASTFHEDQLRGAYAELHDLGELALQEADSDPVQALHRRIGDCEYAFNQAELALAHAELRLEQLQTKTS